MCSLNDATNDVEQKRLELAARHADIESLRTQLGDANTELDSRSSHIVQLESQLAETREQLEATRGELVSLQEQHANACQESASRLERVEQLTARFAHPHSLVQVIRISNYLFNSI